VLREASYYAGMARGLYDYLSAPPVSDAEAVIRRQLENREPGFLDSVRRVVFARADHPYRRMFELAGCSYEDLATAVRRDGLEAALAAIQRAGVYLTHDELKGRTDIVRSGEHIPSDHRSFLNPLVPGLMESSSSGSRGTAMRTRRSTAFQLYAEAYDALRRREFLTDGRPHVMLWPVLPSTIGISTTVRAARAGNPASRWYAVSGTWSDAGHYRAFTAALVTMANLMGTRLPWPRPLPPNDVTPVARWIARQRLRGRSCVLGAFVSSGVRVATAAREQRLDISGTLMETGGEALTDAKRRAIESAGCEVAASYWISEVGPVGAACRQMGSGNCVHLFRDSVAVVSHRRRAPLCDVEVDSLLFTTLLPCAPRLLINAEMDDSGVIEPARCDCVYAAAGFTTRIRDIGSFGKLTGQGMTLMGGDMVRLLEEVLPARVGGSAGDYQLVEREADGETRLTLRVSPRACSPSASKVRECFLQEVRKYYGGSLASRMWAHADAVEVIVGEPITTANGKVQPLHLLRPNWRNSNESHES